MYIEGSAKPKEFFSIFKTALQEAGYEILRDEAIDVTKASTLFKAGGLDGKQNEEASYFLNNSLGVDSPPFAESRYGKMIFNKEVSFNEFIFKISNINRLGDISLIGINSNNTIEEITKIPKSELTSNLSIKSPTTKKYRGLDLAFSNIGAYRIEVILDNGSFIFNELVVKKVVGSYELFYIFILEDAGDSYFLHYSPIKYFDQQKEAVTGRYEHGGIMPKMPLIILDTKGFEYHINIGDRRICGACKSVNGDSITWQPFYTGLLKPYWKTQIDPFLCFGSGGNSLDLVDKNSITLPFVKYQNEYKQALTTPNWLNPPNTKIYSHANKPFSMPIVVCYFGDLGRNNEQVKRISSGRFDISTTKILGEMDGIIAVLLGDGISVGDEIVIDGITYKIITAGNDLMSPYCYALLKE